MKSARVPNSLMSWKGVPIASNGGICRTRGIAEVDDALILILLQQRLKHGAGLRAVFGENIALADIFRALAARKRRLIESNVADEIEGIEVLADFFGERIKGKPFVFEFFDDGLLALGGLPPLEEIVEAGEALLEGLLGEVAQAFR